MPVGTSLNQVPTQIREVTTLAPTGAGSLHEAITTPHNGAGCTIDFDVAGNINRIGMADLTIDQPGVQIRGETAPGEGINLVGCGYRVKRSGIVLSNHRVVPGDKGGNVPSPDNRDCIGLEGESQPVEDILIEGMTLPYAIDGAIDLYSSNRIKRVTIRRCIIAEALDASIHPSGSHSTGLLISKGEDVLVQENLFAHLRLRNPAIRGTSNVALVNNLYYNCADQHWQLYAGDANQTGGTVLLAIIGNVAIVGRNMPWWRAAGHYEPLVSGMSAFPATRIYMSDNETKWHSDFVNGNAGLGITARSQYLTTDAFPTNTAVMQGLGYSIMSATNVVDLGSVVPMAKALVQAHVLANAGPRRADGTLRDSILETRLRAEVVDGRTGTLKNTVPAAEAAYFGFPSPPPPVYTDIDDTAILAAIKAEAETRYPNNQTTDTTLVPSSTRTAVLPLLDVLNVGTGQPLATVDAVRAAALSGAAELEALVESIDRQRANNSKPYWQG